MKHFLLASLLLSSLLLLLIACGENPPAPSGLDQKENAVHNFEVYASTSILGDIFDNGSRADRSRNNSVKGDTQLCRDRVSTCCVPGSNCSPLEIKLKVFKAWISSRADCANAFLIADNEERPLLLDLLQNPLLLKSAPAPGTYRCLILKISDTFIFKPNNNSSYLLPNCHVDQEVSFDYFRSDQAVGSFYDFENHAQVVAEGKVDGVVEQAIQLFFTTDPQMLAGDPLMNKKQIISLYAPITIKGGPASKNVFFMNFTNSIYEDKAQICSLDNINIGFRSL